MYSGKQCQVALCKTYFCNMQCNGKFGCGLQNITHLMCKILSIVVFFNENPPVERKLFHIINGETTASVYDESCFIDQSVTCKGIKPNIPIKIRPLTLMKCCRLVLCGIINLSAINRLIACLHFEVQRDNKPRFLGFREKESKLSYVL